MDKLKLSHIYYDNVECRNAVFKLTNKEIVKLEFTLLECFYNEIFQTRSYIADEYDKKIYLRKDPVNKEILDMVRSKDQETIQLGIKLLLSSKKPADQSVYNDLYETLSILNNMYMRNTNNTIRWAMHLWAYICDLGDFEKRYLSNMANKYTVSLMDLRRIEF